MFAVINSVLLRPLSYPEPDRLVTLRESTEQIGELWGVSNPDFIDVRRANQTLALAAWTYAGGTISAPGEPEYVNGRQISAELFSTLGISPAQGRAFRPDEDRPGAPAVAIVSYGLWQHLFGSEPSTIGRSLVYEGKLYTVIGIAPAGFQLDGDAEIFTPLQQRQTTDPRMQNRAARFLRVIARLRPGFALSDARVQLALIAQHLAQEYPKSNAGLSMTAYPLQTELVGDIGSTLWLLLGAVGVVLLIACVNIASLLLARAVSSSLARQRFLLLLFGIFAGLALLLACIGIYGVLAYLTGQRVPEIGVRMTLGANPVDVMRLVLGQSLVMIFVGVGVGILAALAAGRILNRLVEGMRPADASTFAITIPVLVVAALFASLVPARRTSRIDPVTALRQQ
jgi:hypothetical protein